MSEQRSFADLAWTQKRKVTRRERFLDEMNAVIPWGQFLALLDPHYPKAGNGRPPLGLEKMLRIYFLQQWFDLSDPLMEDSLYDVESMRRFVGIDLSQDVVPDESSILRFRHLLERHQLTEALFAAVKVLLAEKRLLLTAGTIVDATIMHAPASTKNAAGARDPEMSATKKGANWHFGMKAHIGTDTQGLVHSLTTTSGRENDLSQLGALLHGEETAIFGDSAYASEPIREQCAERGIQYRMNQRGTRSHSLTKHEKRINRARSQVRAFVEHPFRVVKEQWGFRKVRYRGLAKNTVRLFAAFALANLYMMRHRLRTV